MVEFIIKSTISLGILYLVYILVLCRLKTFQFNRYFLLGSLVLSVTIPFISIPINNDVVPVMDMAEITSFTESIVQTGSTIAVGSDNGIVYTNLFLYVYLAISLILLIRFGLNLFNIITTINSSQKERRQNYTLALVQDKILPHSFFNYIMINENEYKDGRVDSALIQHEITHANQMHSMDIVFIELLKIALWINPFFWLLKKPIQLNHEYLADNSVIANHNILGYKEMLINIVLDNNSGILVSNFDFSLTKQRLKMMSKHFSSTNAIIGKVTSSLALLLIGISLSFVQKPIIQDSAQNHDGEWWYPILKKHNIELSSFNNFENLFEMGTKNSISNGVVTLENALFLFKPTEEGYVILRSQVAYHNTNDNTIKAENGEFKNYKLDKGEVSSIDHIMFKEISIELENGIPNYIKISGGAEANNDAVDNN